MWFSSAAAQLLEHSVAKMHGTKKEDSKKTFFDQNSTLSPETLSQEQEWNENRMRYNDSIKLEKKNKN